MSQNDFKNQQIDVAQSVRVISQRVENMYSMYSESLRNEEKALRQVKAQRDVINNYDAEWKRRGTEPILPYGMTAAQFTDRISFLEAELKKFKDYGRLKDLAKMKVERARDEALQKVERWDELQVENSRLRVSNEELRALNTRQAEAYQVLEKRVIVNKSTANQIKEDLVQAATVRSLQLQVTKANRERDDAKEQRLKLIEEKNQLAQELRVIREIVGNPNHYFNQERW